MSFAHCPAARHWDGERHRECAGQHLAKIRPPLVLQM